jgi:hypothetical protein
MAPSDRERWWIYGYISAFLVLWIVGEGIPRLLDFLVETEEPTGVVEIIPSGPNGTSDSAETVVQEAIQE